VTGAAHGIGAAVAERAAQAGYSVALIDRDEPAVRGQAQRLARDGASCLALACDVSSEQEVRDAFAEVGNRLGPVTALVTSAGIDRGAAVHELASSTWDQVHAVNLRGTFLACRAVLATMLVRGGSIVCISSPFALASAGHVAAYASSKAGVCALVRSMAVDYARYGIRVNAVLPGPTDTRLMWANVPEEEIEDVKAQVCCEVPIGRLAEPAEIAETTLWLLSDAASYITGAQIPCDGGLLAKAAISV